MVYSPQRRHAVASLASTTQALSLLQHLYTPNVLVLVARILAQIQISSVANIHKDRSLFTLFMMLNGLHFVAVLLHLLDFAGGMNGGRGIVLDFIGQAYPASLLRIMILDILLYGLQLLSLIIAYVNNQGKNLQKSASLPYEDLLLPQEDILEVSEEDDLDLESGGTGWLRRRKGKGVDYGVQNEEGEELWLDDEEDERIGSSSQATSRTRLLNPANGPNSRKRIRDPPLIFSLPLVHIIQLVFQLPAPMHTRSFSGGTPLPTPPITPATEIPPPLFSSNTLSTIAESTEESHYRSSIEREVEEEAESQVESLSARETRSRGGNVGPIPGDYWVGTGRGDGG